MEQSFLYLCCPPPPLLALDVRLLLIFRWGHCLGLASCRCLPADFTLLYCPRTEQCKLPKTSLPLLFFLLLSQGLRMDPFYIEASVIPLACCPLADYTPLPQLLPNPILPCPHSHTHLPYSYTPTVLSSFTWGEGKFGRLGHGFESNAMHPQVLTRMDGRELVRGV